jgi:hypothetical protein
MSDVYSPWQSKDLLAIHVHSARHRKWKISRTFILVQHRGTEHTGAFILVERLRGSFHVNHHMLHITVCITTKESVTGQCFCVVFPLGETCNTW